MNNSRQRTLRDLLILALLPAPLIFMGLLLLLMYAIMSGFELDLGSEEPAAPQAALVSTLPRDVSALATLNALPTRPQAEAIPAQSVDTGDPAEESSAADPAAAPEVASAGYDPAQVQAGRDDYLAVCAACHGVDAQGVTGLGKALIGSEFMRGIPDDELHQFIVVGREIWDPLNTTGIAMPPRGGNPGLTDEAIDNIIAYLRTEDAAAGGPMPGASAGSEAAPAEESSAADPAAAPEVAALSYDEGQVSAGREDYLAVCSACHGVDAQGVAGLGKPLIGSEFVRTVPDDELHEFIVVGREIWDPLNTTGIAMPARGGNPGLTDEAIDNIIAYLRVQDAAIGGPAAEIAAFTDSAVPTDPDPADALAPADAAVPEGSAVEGAPVEFVQADVPALLNSLGLVLPEPLPQPDLDGPALYARVCGVRYEDSFGAGEVYTASQDYCDFLQEAVAEGTYSDEELLQLLQEGLLLWLPENESGLHLPPRLGYPPLSDDDLRDLIAYLHEIAQD